MRDAAVAVPTDCASAAGSFTRVVGLGIPGYTAVNGPQASFDDLLSEADPPSLSFRHA